MYRIMSECGVPTENNLGYHMLYRAAWDGLICMGPQHGREQTFALLDEWIRKFRSPGKDEIFRELAYKYFSGHGPATLRDFAWWSGLKVTEAREGIARAGNALMEVEVNGNIYYTSSKNARGIDGDGAFLLPAFDEYILGYSDRAPLTGEDPNGKGDNLSVSRYMHKNGILLPTVLWKGKVIGTWKKKQSEKAVKIHVQPFAELELGQTEGIKEAGISYGEFLEKDIQLKIGD